MGILIIFTLIISVLSLFTVIILFIRQNRLFHLEQKYKQLQNELEQSITSFLIEIREENDKFLRNLEQVKPVKVNKTKLDNHEKMNNDKLDNHIQSTDLEIKDLPNYSGLKEYKTIAKQVKNNDKNALIKDVKNEYDEEMNKIIRLVDDGYSIEEIAKSLNKGKTEVELLIKFSSSLQKE